MKRYDIGMIGTGKSQVKPIINDCSSGDFLKVSEVIEFLKEKYKNSQPYTYCGEKEYDRLEAKNGVIEDIFVELNLGSYKDIKS